MSLKTWVRVEVPQASKIWELLVQRASLNANFFQALPWIIEAYVFQKLPSGLWWLKTVSNT